MQVHLGAEAMGMVTAVLLLALGFRMHRVQMEGATVRCSSAWAACYCVPSLSSYCVLLSVGDLLPHRSLLCWAAPHCFVSELR